MYHNTTRNGQMTVDGTNAVLPFTRIINLAALLRDEDVIGDDTRVSGGKVLNPQRGDGLRETLTLWFSGDVDHTGTPYGDAIDGMVANIFWYRTNITGRTGVGDGTKTIIVTLGGQTVTGTGRTGPLLIGTDREDGGFNASFDVWFPAAAPA